MLGVGITAGGWIVEYLVSARNGKLPDVGYVPAGLWGGIFLGRVLLTEPTHRFGERRMTMGYCTIILALQLIFWLVPNIVSSAVAISFLGFFFGPMFATGMSIATKLFPKRIQPTALGNFPYYLRWLRVVADCWQGLCLSSHKPVGLCFQRSQE